MYAESKNCKDGQRSCFKVFSSQIIYLFRPSLQAFLFLTWKLRRKNREC